MLGPELHGRLVWLVRLRWWPVLGLAFAGWVAPPAGFPDAWGNLLWVALLVASYNVVFDRRLRRALRPESPFGQLQVWAILQMVMDIGALLAVVHFTGGMTSPALPFFVFHMAIGTMMIAAEKMYLIALGTCWAASLLFIAEAEGVLPQHALAGGASPTLASIVGLLALVVAVFGTVYLTDSVASRFLLRTVELHEATAALHDRTANLQRLLAERAALEQRKSKFMLLSAHQLRSPLATVKTSLAVVTQGYVDPASERGQRLIAGALERVDSLLAIVSDLLELAKVREGRARAPWAAEVSLNQIVTDVIENIMPLAEERGLRLTSELQARAVLARGVPPDLVYACENLLHNAIKYSRTGGDVRLTLGVDRGEAVLTVADDGIGIPAEMLDDVFVEFVRASNARRHGAEGTGLGLAIVREVVEAHGGRVTVASVEGEGSTFTVRLPLAAVVTTG